MLLARAEGKSEVLVYHGDISKLDMAVKGSDICLIDTFPSVNPARFMAACKDIAGKIIII